MEKNNLKIVCTYSGEETAAEIIIRSFRYYIKTIPHNSVFVSPQEKMNGFQPFDSPDQKRE